MAEAKPSRLAKLVLALAALALVASPAYAKYGGGTGAPNDPYLIYTAEQMNTIGAEPNDWGKHFRLTADIDLSAYEGAAFNLIGSKTMPFSGVFDGNGKMISHFRYVCTSQDEIALFRYVSGKKAEIRNLCLTDVNVNADTGRNVASLVAYIPGGTVVNCGVTGGTVHGGENVGGLVGINGPGVGRSLDPLPTVKDCGFAGVVSAPIACGGLLGYNDTGYVINCCADAQVSGGYRVGGLAGFSRDTITGCYAVGHVTGRSSVGGLVGDMTGRATNCYAAVSLSGDSRVGGLIGSGPGLVTGSFWDVEASGQVTSIGGRGKTTAEMQRAATFWAWNGCENEGLWTIDEGQDYPRLSWENRPGRPIASVRLSDLFEGAGTQDDPYLIGSAEQLNVIGLFPCAGDKHFRLVADIDLSVYTGTQFNVVPEFLATFDGNHHTISNFTYEAKEASYVALFAAIRGNAQVKNLGLINPRVDAGTGMFVAPLAGTTLGATISNCYAAGGHVSAAYYVGGLIGASNGLVSESYATVQVSGMQTVGGLVGSNQRTITACYAAGDVAGELYVGGLAGESGRTVRDCYATGSVSGGTCVGGLVGGIVSSSGTVENCYATGRVSGNNEYGGLVGNNDFGTVTESFWDIETSGIWTSAGGTGEVTDRMKSGATFSAWNASSDPPVWTIDEGRDYPRLQWEGRPGQAIPTLVSILLAGAGTADDPYRISTAQELNTIGLCPFGWSRHFKLMADIDLSAYTGTSFNMIGREDQPFSGVFDGAGHIISNFQYAGSDANFVGLFRYIDGPTAEVRDLGLVASTIDVGGGRNIGVLAGCLRNGAITDCYATGAVMGSGNTRAGGLLGWNAGTVADCHASTTVGGGWVGGLIGRNEGTVTNCYASGDVGSSSGAGGLIGSNYGTVTNCHATGCVDIGAYIGGLVASNDGTIINCRSSGAIAGDFAVGGLVGCNNSMIVNCHSTGSIIGGMSVGGLVGYDGGGTLRACYAKGNVCGVENIGGLIGVSNGSVESCRASGAVAGFTFVGGLIGVNAHTVRNCYAAGGVDGHLYVGGLAGLNDGAIANCYAAGSTSGKAFVGGLVGVLVSGSTVASFWDVEAVHQQTSAGGIGKSASEMKTGTTYLDAGWDFVGEAENGTEDIWWILEGQDYPRLNWEKESP